MSAARQKGTAFETSLIPVLASYYPGAERRAMQGRYDKGDFYLPGETRFALEAKNVSKMDLPGWYAEACAEAQNLGVPHGVIVHKRKGRTAPELQWVTTSLDSFLSISRGG